MAKQIIFEVHVFQNGRWEIQGRHESSEMKAAIADAKGLDQLPNIDMVKVILEEYDDETGHTTENIVYRSAGMADSEGGPISMASKVRAEKKSNSSFGGSSASSAGSSFFDDDDDDDFDDDFSSARARKSARARRPGGPRKTTFVGVLVKILLIILFSVTIAALMAGGAIMFLRDTSLSSNVQTNIVFVMFIVIFLLSAVVMSMNFMRKDEISTPNIHAPSRRQRPKKAPKKAPRPEKTKSEKEERPTKKKIEKDEDLDPSEEGLASKAGEELKEQLSKEKSKEEEKEEKNATPDPEEEQEDETPEPEPEVPASLSAHAEKQRVYLMTFLSEGLERCEADTKKLDSFNKFGLNLYLAGASEIMGQARNLDHYSLTKILAETVSLMGFKDADAAKFAEKYEDYLLADARYMQMFQAGRNAMNSYMEKNPEAMKYLGQALTDWNKPTQKEESTGPVTVLFTDIAGSTAMTQNLGDAVAQQIVRAHNRIVREALTQFAGKEIKHTGDGIMASFSTTSNGVEGSIKIQIDTAKHNENNPDLPLHIKIGLNAGEPISEDNDLFGSTVQMAARIVDKAKADEIFVSEIVRGICAGKETTFKNRGPFAMKGFDEDPILYEVVWKKEE
ncbi:MAG: adenylate/guanylate cyclase domain-containing protein [Rhodospirillaceae bacterium]|nr:adenylate/guanylate cyclase domain-containing protein [Rhodospirillaceae bacterium]